jgi:hypothetical protein
MNLTLKENMSNRTPVYAVDIYVLLQREFRRRQAPECNECYVQLPFRVDRPDADSSNWEAVLPPPCAFGCRQIMIDLIGEFQSLYDLRPDGANRAS